MPYPSAATTGPAAGGYTSLTPQTAAQIHAAGPWPPWVQVIGGGPPSGSLLVEACSFTAGIDCYASNISFLGCQIATSSVITGSVAALNIRGNNTLIQYCQISAPDTMTRLETPIGSATGASNLTIDSCNLFWCSDGINIGGNASNVTITNNYIHDLIYYSPDHDDCILFEGSDSSVTIHNNTLLNPLDQTSCISLYQNFGTSGYSNVSITGNYLAGGGYCIYCGASGSGPLTNMVFTGNVFSQQFWPAGGFYGPLAYQPNWGTSGNVWKDNQWVSPWVLIGSDVQGWTGSSYAYTFPAGAPSAGQLDVLCVSVAGGTASAPAGFTTGPAQASGPVSAYIFYRIAASGAPASVTISLSGSLPAQVAWSRWSGSQVFADATGSAIRTTSHNNTPSVSTGALSQPGELSVAFAALQNGTAEPGLIVWDTVYLPLVTSSYDSDQLCSLTAANVTAGPQPRRPT